MGHHAPEETAKEASLQAEEEAEVVAEAEEVATISTVVAQPAHLTAVPTYAPTTTRPVGATERTKRTPLFVPTRVCAMSTNVIVNHQTATPAFSPILATLTETQQPQHLSSAAINTKPRLYFFLVCYMLIL